MPCRYCNTIFCIFIAGVNSMILTIYVMSMSIVDSPSKTESDNELCYDDCTTISLDPEEMEANRIFCIQAEADDNPFYYECGNCEVVSTVRYPREFANMVSDFVTYTKEKFGSLNYTDLMDTCQDVYKDLKPGTKSRLSVYEERQLNMCSIVPHPNNFVCNEFFDDFDRFFHYDPTVANSKHFSCAYMKNVVYEAYPKKGEW